MSGGITPYLLAGPEIAVKAGSDVVVGGQAGNYTCAGIDFRIGKRRYTMSARYDYGVRNVVKNNDAKNRTFGVVAGLAWSGAGKVLLCVEVAGSARRGRGAVPCARCPPPTADRACPTRRPPQASEASAR